MANGFSVTISAVDKATATLNQINKSIDGIAKPVKRLGAQAQAFAQKSGLSDLAKGFGEVARGAGEVFSQVARIVEPLAAISGVASLAGMYRLVGSWAEFGTRLGFAAQRIGISTEGLMGLQGAARLAGGSAEAMTSGLRTLHDAMTDALAGRNPDALLYLRQFHIEFQNLDGSVRSSADVLPQLADRIAAIKNPSLQARVATALLGGAAEDLLPILRQSSAGLAEYQREAARYGLMNEAGADAARQFSHAQTQLSLAVETLGNRISVRLAPVIAPLLTQFADWIAASPQVEHGINQLAVAVQNFATWVQHIDWDAVGRRVEGVAFVLQHVVDLVGGWQNAIEGLMIFMAARWTIGLVAPFVRLGIEMTKVAGTLIGLVYRLIPQAISGIRGMGTAAVEAETAAKAAAAPARMAPGPRAGIGGLLGNLGLLLSMYRIGSDILTGNVPDTALKDLSPDDPRWATVPEAQRRQLPNSPENDPDAGRSWLRDKLFGRSGSGNGSVPKDAGSAPRGIRDNNPLNLTVAPGQNTIGADGRFGVYRSRADGVAAATRQLQRYQDRGFDTIGKIVSRWAPPSENDTAGYIAAVSRRMGIAPDIKLDLHDAATAEKLVSAMSWQENGRALNPADVHISVAQALGLPPMQAPVAQVPGAPAMQAPPAQAPAMQVGDGTGAQAAPGPSGKVTVDVVHSNAPAGVNAKIASSGDVSTSLRTEQAMPMAALP